jgi:hypothetical protein
VVKDWLEDCLIGHVSQKRCRAEKWYTLGRVLKRVDDGLKKQKEYRLRFENGVRAGFELVDNSKPHSRIPGSIQLLISMARLQPCLL